MFHGSGWWRYIAYDESKGKPRVSKTLLRRVLSYATPYWKSVSVVLITIITISLLELIPPLLFRDLIDNVLPNRDISQLNLIALAMIGIPVMTGLIGVAQRYFSARAGEGIIFDLRQQMYQHLQRMSIRFFTHTKSGEIISRFNNDVVDAQNAVTGTLPGIVTNLFTLISTLVVMLTIEWRLTLLSVAVVPLFLLPAKRVARILRDIRRKAMKYNAEMSSIINETLSINGALLVKIFARQNKESSRFRDANKKVRDAGVRRALVGRWFFMGLGLSAAIGTALIYWAGGHLVLRDAISIGTIVAFAAYLTRLYTPISGLTNIQVEFATSMVSFERVFEYLDLPAEILDKENALNLKHVQGKIDFENVSFSYLRQEDLSEKPTPPSTNGSQEKPSRNPLSPQTPIVQEDIEGETPISDALTRRWALHDVTFEIKPGELVALVGPSGAGKTTITYLLPRLYDPSLGQICIDGYDIRDLTQESLARQIGMVTQETYLFHDTVRANLLYARSDASTEEIEAACRAANIHEFIENLPEGYDTMVGERGYRLSGGEKQRIAIARVILKNPRILILDEATSHLDSQSEALIQSALEPLLEGRTSLVIAHRLSTILSADKIIVLNEGKLVECGTHEELLEQNGVYAQLYLTQFKVELEAT